MVVFFNMFKIKITFSSVLFAPLQGAYSRFSGVRERVIFFQKPREEKMPEE